MIQDALHGCGCTDLARSIHVLVLGFCFISHVLFVHLLKVKKVV